MANLHAFYLTCIGAYAQTRFKEFSKLVSSTCTNIATNIASLKTRQFSKLTNSMSMFIINIHTGAIVWRAMYLKRLHVGKSARAV